MQCPSCNNELTTNARFCATCGRPIFEQTYPVQTRIFRPRHGRAIGGVCAAFAQHFGWDIVLVRLAVVAIALFSCGVTILAYIGAWIVIPNEPYYFGAPPVAPPPATPATPADPQTSI